MHKIGDDTITADPSDEFTEGDPVTNTPATEVKAEWLNSIQRELINVIEYFGLVPTQDQDDQLMSILRTFSPAMGLRVQANVPTDMNAVVKAGVFQRENDIFSVVETILPLNVSAIDDRIDRIVIDDDGALSVIEGTESATPVPPSISRDTVSLAQIFIANGATQITPADIIDERPSLYVARTKNIGNYIKTSTDYIHQDGHESATIDISNDVLDIFQSFGPTSSGADVEKAELDVIPVGAKFVRLRFQISMTNITPGATTRLILQYQKFGGPGDKLAYNRIARTDTAESDGTSEAAGQIAEVLIPLDANRRFELATTQFGNLNTKSVLMAVIGFRF